MNSSAYQYHIQDTGSAGSAGGTESLMKLGEMNWPDIRDLDKERLVAVYPIASFEQHGLHLPLLTDTIQLDAMVEDMDAKIGDRVVCLPTQWLGYSFHHMRFGGSLTAHSQTHIRMLVETVEGLIEAGFDKVLADRLHSDGGRPPSAHAGRVDHFRRIDEHSSRGNFGDPTVATAEKGRRMLDATVDCLVEIVDDILSEKL
jgi:creatinine amidohydrolase/Fe(II)-dependent formamide hydrolase-like protein